MRSPFCAVAILLVVPLSATLASPPQAPTPPQAPACCDVPEVKPDDYAWVTFPDGDTSVWPAAPMPMHAMPTYHASPSFAAPSYGGGNCSPRG